MENLPLTPKQKTVLTIIETYNKENGFMPSLSEIADEMGITIPSVWEHLDRLQKKGYVRRYWNGKRLLEII